MEYSTVTIPSILLDISSPKTSKNIWVETRVTVRGDVLDTIFKFLTPMKICKCARKDDKFSRLGLNAFATTKLRRAIVLFIHII